MKNRLPDQPPQFFRGWKKFYGLCCLLSLSSIAVFAQQIQVSGTVSSEEFGEELPGVNVMVKGSSEGTITNIDGFYRIEVPNRETTLVFSFVGYKTTEVVVGNRSTVNVQLESDARELSEVVVTALGVERESRALGYAVQEIEGEEIAEARETNLVNSLAGKAAGVQVTNGSSGIGGSSRITIRGESSLNINKNQPLFVVDGVPISNEVYGSSGRGHLEVDYGNSAGEINPNDVASISILKGPAAAALYGSRAANGAVIITTKSGKGSRGIGVTLNSSTTFEEPLRLPKWQNVYGQGNNGQFAFVDGAGGGIADGVDESWGPRMDTGLMIPQFDSPRDIEGYRGGDLNAPAESAIQPTPWVSRPGNIDEFFETGLTLSNNIALTGSNESGNFRLSFTDFRQTGIVPNTNLTRNTVSLTGGYNLSDKLKANAVVNYIKSQSDNRPAISYGTESLMYLWIWYGRQINTLNLQDYWMPGLEGVQQFNYNYNYHDNPYFTSYENLNGQDKDRVYGNVSLTYNFTDELSLMLRSGTDFANDLRARRRAFSTQRFPFGSYREEKIYFEERNTDFLLSYQKQVNQNWSANISFGGNQMRQRYNLLDIMAPQLSIPGIYNFGNSRVPLESYDLKTNKRINSLYGYAQIGFKDMVFLDLTARNDWSSTLPEENNSYFYPSATLSAVVSDIFQVPTSSPLSFAKVRLALAQVGNDTDPYSLYNVYNYAQPWGTDQTVTESATLNNPELKPELVSTYEVGADVRFFNGRLGLDFTYYDIRSTNQIIPVEIPISSGYTRRVLNAGEIRNRGVELMLNATPIQLSNGLSWNTSVNFTRNRGVVVELAPEEGIEIYNLSSANGAYIQARTGQPMGAIYGYGNLRVTDQESPYYGQHIHSPDGTPLTSNELEYQGNYNPDWMMGFQNTFSFKGISLGFLFDARYGGIVISRTKTIGSTSGQLEETLLGRPNGYDLSLPENGIIGKGVKQVFDEEGNLTGYAPNDMKISSRDWHNRYYERNNAEVAKYDASYLKLREVKIGYSIPSALLGRSPLKGIDISLVGRNLFLWTENPHFDPETAGMSGGTLIPGMENMAYPSVRSMGVNLSLKL